MKKILALLLALSLCAALCACGEEKAPAEGAPRSDISATPIPKPDGGTAPEKPVATPAPTEAPEPAVPIEVLDLCRVAGTHATNSGYNEYFSFTLPEVSGPDTAYLRALNEEVQGIYDDYVAPSLEAMESDGYLPHYCTCFRYAFQNGIHSLLITCDSDWGEDYYWCFNFDDAGNEVGNADVLKAAGMTESEFVAAARGFFTDWTDLSEYFEDDSWKEYQEKTVADDNCNAAMPMALLPDGNLCFIGTIYTPAGAGVYDYALEFSDKGEIGMSEIGIPLISRLYGSYLVDADDVATEDGTSYLLDFFTVGDTLTVEITGFDAEEGAVFFYNAADIFPEDPEDLLFADTDSLRVRVAPYCPDVFGGTYYGEPGSYTMTIGEDYVSFTDFKGGTRLLGGGDFTAHSVYRGDLGLDDAIPDTDYDHFDYDDAEASGLPGVWAGYYVDEAYDTHSLTLEMTSWGALKMRDCVDGQIPRVMQGSYYLNTLDGDYPADTVVFELVSRAGYKQPTRGCCYMFLSDGTLLIDEEVDGWYDKMTQVDYENYYCVLTRVPEIRYLAEPQIKALEENETVEIDLDQDGTAEELSYYFTRDKDSGDAITGFTFVLNGEETDMDDQWLYDADVWFIRPAYSGAAFFYVDGVSDNDGHYLQIIGADADGFRFAGDYFGGFAEDPTDVEDLHLRMRSHLLSTAGCVRSYRVGPNGMPEATEPFFYADGELTLTAKQDLDVWIVAPDTGEPVDTATLTAGTKVTLLRTDGGSFWDLKLENGDVRRIWIDTSDRSQNIGGKAIDDCFDGVVRGG